jgi:lipoate-protein ligase A
VKIRLVNEAAAGGSGGPGLPGALNMGIDEAVVEAIAAGRSPATLRFYRWSPPCVTVGYFQSMEEEVDLAACAAQGVDAVRRVTGGGAVFHDAEITYSLIVPEGTPLAPADILESYGRICSGIVAGLGLMGVEASFAPINDIQAGGRKVSGNAQTRKRGCLLQHGTVLLGVDVERMFGLLKVPAEKLKGKLIADVKARVTGLDALLGREPGFDEAAAALGQGFASALGQWGAEFEEGQLAEAELSQARELARTKYGTAAWNLKR